MTMTAPAPDQVMETWEMTVPGRVWVQTTGHNRFGQPIQKDVSVGPNKIGAKLKISVADREMNQESIERVDLDPFRNGTLIRVRGGDPLDPGVASPDAMSAGDLTELFEKSGNAFHAAVDALGEVPVRRMRALCDAIDASASQRDYLDEVINDRYRSPGSSQGTGSAVYNLAGERVGTDGTPYGEDD